MATASADAQMLSPYDVADPAVGNLDPALRIAVQQAEGTGLPVHRIRTAGGREVADIFDGYLSTLLRKS